MTIKDLAELLGMAHTTVSRALNDHPRISIATKGSSTQSGGQTRLRPACRRPTDAGGREQFGRLLVPDVQNELYGAGASIMAGEFAQRGLQLVTRTAMSTRSGPCAKAGQPESSSFLAEPPQRTAFRCCGGSRQCNFCARIQSLAPARSLRSFMLSLSIGVGPSHAGPAAHMMEVLRFDSRSKSTARRRWQS
jgi:hypothetical protein